MKEFVPNNLGLQIMGASGKYVDFAGIAYMGDTAIWRVEFTNHQVLECSGAHRLFGYSGLRPVDEVKVGDRVARGDGRFTKVKTIEKTDRVEAVYDIIEASDGHRYVSNGVVSSNCSFVTDDETLINPLTLTHLTGRAPEFYVDESRWYMEPIANQIYLVALDPSLGTENDASAIQIFTVPGMRQVAEWQSNKTNPRGQMRTLLRMLHFLDEELRNNPDQDGEPEIYWTIENNTLGEANLLVIDEIGEHNFPGIMLSERRKRGQTKRFRKGLTTGKHSKIAACATLKNLFEGGRIEVYSTNLVIELKNYVRREQSFAAKPGMHDDLVATLVVIVRMMQIVRSQGIELGSDLANTFSEDEIFGMPMPVVL